MLAVTMDSPIKWVGGKSRLREKIITMIPPHKTYVEPFGGALWILFDKPPSPIEIISDLDSELINLYMVIQYHHKEFIEYLDKTPISENLFKALVHGWKSTDGRDGLPSTSSTSKEYQPNIPQAGNYYFILMNAFNGNISDGRNPTFSLSPERSSAFIRFYSTNWDRVAVRLKKVTIVNRDFENLITKLDGPETFFYLDPPYFVATDSKRYYRKTFKTGDHKRLLDLLKNIQGKFILSYGNNENIKAMYKDFYITIYDNDELLITNYKPLNKPFYIPCSKGMPSQPGEQIKGSWEYPNCPYCHSRNVQQTYKRTSLGGGKRNYPKCGFCCNDCGSVFK